MQAIVQLGIISATLGALVCLYLGLNSLPTLIDLLRRKR